MVLMYKYVKPDCLDEVTADKPTSIHVTPFVENMTKTSEKCTALSVLISIAITEQMKAGDTLNELGAKIVDLIHTKSNFCKPARTWDIDGKVENVKEEITVVDK